jgi:hypothetical protein
MTVKSSAFPRIPIGRNHIFIGLPVVDEQFVVVIPYNFSCSGSNSNIAHK